jgi:riboflavin biosynthesis pyrimidine reductase
MRAGEKPEQPLRCVVSRSGKFDPNHPLFNTPGGDIHLLVTGKKTVASPVTMMTNVTLHYQSLLEFIETLAIHYHIKHLHCEGGGELINELAELDLIDDFHVTLAGHTLFGGQAAPTATGIPTKFLPATRSYEIQDFEALPDSGECFVSYRRIR